MRRKFEIALGLFCIFVAIYSFDIYNRNMQIASGMLAISGVLTISRNEKLNKILRYSAVALAVWLMIRIWLYGN